MREKSPSVGPPGDIFLAAAKFIIMCDLRVPVWEEHVDISVVAVWDGPALPKSVDGASLWGAGGSPQAGTPEKSLGRRHDLSDSGQPGDLQPTLPLFNLFMHFDHAKSL